MARRLIITNGNSTTSHEIGESEMVIGRDPSCDLFFPNQKLSRQHARVEPGPYGVKLVDLGSRNGMWVNEERVGERWLQPGDAIRLGGLTLGFEEDSPSLELEGDEATVVLPTRETEKTVALRSGEPPNTVPAPRPVVNQKLELTKKTAKPPEPGDGSATVSLSGKMGAGDGKERTRYFAGEAATLAPGPEAPVWVAESRPFVTVVRRHLDRLAQVVGSSRGASFLARAAERFARLNWETKLVLVLSGLGLIVMSTLVIIVLRTHSAPVAVLAGFPLMVGWSYSAVVLARHLTVRPVAELARDVNAFRQGEKAVLVSPKGYPELDRLSKGIGRLVGGAESSPVSTDPSVADSRGSDSRDSN